MPATTKLKTPKRTLKTIFFYHEKGQIQNDLITNSYPSRRHSLIFFFIIITSGKRQQTLLSNMNKAGRQPRSSSTMLHCMSLFSSRLEDKLNSDCCSVKYLSELFSFISGSVKIVWERLETPQVS